MHILVYELTTSKKVTIRLKGQRNKMYDSDWECDNIFTEIAICNRLLLIHNNVLNVNILYRQLSLHYIGTQKLAIDEFTTSTWLQATNLSRINKFLNVFLTTRSDLQVTSPISNQCYADNIFKVSDELKRNREIDVFIPQFTKSKRV